MEAVLGHADAPWYYKASANRVQHAALMYQEALDWIKGAYPYWERMQGRDHIWCACSQGLVGVRGRG